MELEKLTRKDMDDMEIETVITTKFKPIRKEMSHVTQIIINKNIIEEKQFEVPKTLEDKNAYFVSISNELQEKAGKILHDIYNRQ